MFLSRLILILAATVCCFSERLIVELANGGTSRPLLTFPLEHIHYEDIAKAPMASALTGDNPEAIIEDADSNLSILQGNDTVSPTKNETADTLPIIPGNDTLLKPEEITAEVTGSYVQDRENITPISKNASAIVQSSAGNITTETGSAETASLRPSTQMVLNKTPGPMIRETSPSPPTSTRPPLTSTNRPKPVLPCHQSCHEALNATKLYLQHKLPSQDKILLSQGSDLTLICELPLNPSFVLENLIWLYHPENSPTGQCSLTSQEFIASCPGFQTINDTKDRNDTFIRETVTLLNILAQNAGQYICQVTVTCCSHSNEHSMNQERISNIKVQVWLPDYTVDLAIAGSLTAILAIIFLGGTYYMMRNQQARYIYITNEIQEIKPTTVLHIPLVDDQDNDSFDSNFDEEE